MAGPVSAGEIAALELSGAEVPEVLKVISDISGWTIIPSGKLTGKVSFFAKDATCRELFDGLVKANDWVAVKEGNVIVLLTREEYAEQYGPVRQVTRVFQVGFQSSAEIAGLIKPLLSKEGQVVADKLSGRIAVRDTQTRVEEVAQVIAKLQEGLLTEVFQLQHAAAADLIATIRGLVAVPGNVAHDPRTNQIVVTDHSLNIARVRQTLERLDREDICFTRTFRLEHADCLEVQRTLQQALGRPVARNPGCRWSSRPSRARDWPPDRPSPPTRGSTPSSSPTLPPCSRGSKG